MLAAYFGSQLFVAAAVTIVVTGLYAPTIKDPQQLSRHIERAVTLPATVLGFAVGAWVIVRLVLRTFPGFAPAEVFRTLGLTRGAWREVIAAAGLGLVVALVYVFVLLPRVDVEPSQPWGPLVTAASEPGWQRHLWALVALLLAPPVEEFLFRGVLFEGFTQAWGQTRSAIAVTGLFTLFHLPEIRGYWPAILGVGLVATITMATRIKTRSLGPCIALHAAYNFGLVVCVYANIG